VEISGKLDHHCYIKMSLNFDHYILPLAIAKRNLSGGNHLLDRYAGTAFYLTSNGLIATCKHIIEGVKEDEILIVKELTFDSFLEVTNIQSHPKYDFAVGKIGVSGNNFFQPIKDSLSLGDDVNAFGFNFDARQNNIVTIKPRLMKGYVTSMSSSSPSDIQNRSTVEISFPSLSGFSGAPILSHPNGCLAGMLFSNFESTIEVFSYSEVIDKQNNFTEKIYRVVEHGLAHSIDDIRQFLSDLEFAVFF
jgi:hypothetical protein